MATQKTYWHLLQQRRMPTEYEIVTSKLLCYTGEGFTGKRFELDVPLLDWYKRYQQESPLTCSSWEKFQDPRQTTYTRYTDLPTFDFRHSPMLSRYVWFRANQV